MKHVLAKFLLAGAALVLIAGVAPAAVHAHNGEEHRTTAEERRHEAATTRQQAQERAQRSLTDAQKRACENRAKNIETIMERSTTRAENYGRFFSTITQRVIAFIENQQQAVNVQLLDAAETAQAQFRADLAAMKEKAVFSCNSDDPKGQIHEFQESHRAVLQDLRDWRTKLKDLIQQFRVDQEAAE